MMEKANTDLRIKKSSASELVAEEMRSLIVKGIWKIDEKIPSESVLAETFGVNRFTVRMALQKLNTFGILETKVGEGTFVRSFSFEKHIKDIYEFYLTDELLEDVAAFRNILEIGAAELAILHHSAEELEELKRRVEVFERDIRAYVDAKHQPERRQFYFEKFNDDDVEIHYQICKMSHNDLLIYAFTTAKEAIREHMAMLGHKRVIRLEPGENIPSIRNHWAIYEAIEGRDFAACKQLLQTMFDYSVVD